MKTIYTNKLRDCILVIPQAALMICFVSEPIILTGINCCQQILLSFLFVPGDLLCVEKSALSIYIFEILVRAKQSSPPLSPVNWLFLNFYPYFQSFIVAVPFVLSCLKSHFESMHFFLIVGGSLYLTLKFKHGKKIVSISISFVGPECLTRKDFFKTLLGTQQNNIFCHTYFE